MSKLKSVKDAEFQATVQKGVTLVDFYANWCGPCRTLTPVLEEVAETLEEGCQIIKVDIDTEQQTASAFQISSVPTMILFKDGKEVSRLVGLRDAKAVQEFIRSGK